MGGKGRGENGRGWERRKGDGREGEGVGPKCKHTVHVLTDHENEFLDHVNAWNQD